MANYEFTSDLVIGISGEDVVIEDLKKMGAKLISKNDNIKYDVIMEKNGHEVKYEIKTDVYCKPDDDTGNMFVEFECRGKDSGILATEADWFVTYYHHLNEIWYIKTNDLKQLVVSNPIRIAGGAGDKGSNTMGWLIPREEYKKHFIVRKPLRFIEPS